MPEKIKIQIAGRMYPLTVEPKEEEFIRKAGLQIEKMIQNYETRFAVNDKQDALAMCALQLASQLEQQKFQNKETYKGVEKRLNALDDLLSDTK